jgi:hypothetical protein
VGEYIVKEAISARDDDVPWLQLAHKVLQIKVYVIFLSFQRKDCRRLQD